MCRDDLLQLIADGYTFLRRKNGELAYRPLKGSLIENLSKVSVEPMKEDDLIPISNALEYFDNDDFEKAFIILKSVNPDQLNSTSDHQ